MNFISNMEGQEIQVELKYCERCGGLWLRLQGADGVYCASCRVRVAARQNPGEAPPRKARSRRKARVRVTDLRGSTDIQRENFQSPACIEYLQGVATMQVRV